MRNLTIGLALIVLLIVWFRHRQPAPTQAAVTVASESSASANSVPPRIARKNLRQAPPLNGITAKPAGTAQANVIPFQVVDGLAIAYGDVILGQPEDPTIKEGFYDAPPPVLWDRPEIPFAISDDLPNPKRVRSALDYFAAHTPITFVPYEGQPDALVFEPGAENCYSLLGKHGGLQPIKLAADCAWPQIAHEIMHALGFVHEQSRTDRDQYIEILWDNIDPKYRAQFGMVPASYMEVSKQGPFDYNSLMLYSTKIFAAQTGQPTMRSRSQQPIAPLENSLSAGDLERLNQMYRPYAK